MTSLRIGAYFLFYLANLGFHRNKLQDGGVVAATEQAKNDCMKKQVSRILHKRIPIMAHDSQESPSSRCLIFKGYRLKSATPKSKAERLKPCAADRKN